MYLFHVTGKNYKEVKNGVVYQAYMGLKLKDIPLLLKDILSSYRLKFKAQLTNYRDSYEKNNKLVKSNFGE